ncbi:ATP-binding protein [Phormidesmis priestleyi]
MDQQASEPFEHCVLEFLATLSYRAGELSSYLDEIACGVSRLIQSDWSIVTIQQDGTGRVVASSLKLSESDRGFSMHGSLAGEIIRTGQSLLIEDARTDQSQNKLTGEYLCYLGVPLKTAHHQVIGTICSFMREPRQFTADEICTVELFADRAATAIDNYRLYQRQQQFNEALEQEVTARTEELRVAQERLIERERLAAIGQFAATIVHEVRNPLTTIEMGLKYAQTTLPAASAQERLELSLSESYRLKHLLNEILLYAKPQVTQLSRLKLGELLEELLLQMREMPEAIERQIKLTNALPGVEVLGDLDKLKQVFINLFRNALEAIAPGDLVSCEIVRGASSKQVCIQIHNGGDPIPPEILPKLSEPFCSTKPTGTGLGLAIVKSIVVAHCGELTITSTTEGTTVSVQLAIAA